MHYAWASQWYNYYTTLLEKLHTFDQSISILSDLVGIYLLMWVITHFNALLLFHFICDKRWILMLALQLCLLDCHPWTCLVNIMMFSWTTPFLAPVPEMLSAPYGKFSVYQLHINSQEVSTVVVPIEFLALVMQGSCHDFERVLWRKSFRVVWQGAGPLDHTFPQAHRPLAHTCSPSDAPSFQCRHTRYPIICFASFNDRPRGRSALC